MHEKRNDHRCMEQKQNTQKKNADVLCVDIKSIKKENECCEEMQTEIDYSQKHVDLVN